MNISGTSPLESLEQYRFIDTAVNDPEALSTVLVALNPARLDEESQARILNSFYELSVQRGASEETIVLQSLGLNPISQKWEWKS